MVPMVPMVPAPALLWFGSPVSPTHPWQDHLAPGIPDCSEGYTHLFGGLVPSMPVCR